MKVSYYCTQNMGNTVKSHNKKLINSGNHHALPCNCKRKEDCPLEGKYRTENIIYACIVSTSGHPDKVYFGTAQEDFEKIYYNPISFIKIKTQINKTTLAKYVWNLSKNTDLSDLYHLILILQKASCYAYSKSFKC